MASANIAIEYSPTLPANGFPKWCGVKLAFLDELFKFLHIGC